MLVIIIIAWWKCICSGLFFKSLTSISALHSSTESIVQKIEFNINKVYMKKKKCSKCCLKQYAMKFINVQLQIKSCDNIKHRWSKTVVKDHLFSKPNRIYWTFSFRWPHCEFFLEEFTEQWTTRKPGGTWLHYATYWSIPNME